MFELVGNIRGFTRSIVRGAASIGRTLGETFDTLKEAGLGYARDLLTVDFETYNVQPFLTDEIRKLDRDHLISGGYHAETEMKLALKFRYEVQCEYEALDGTITKRTWTVSNDRRMTQNEINDEAGIFAEEYAPEGFPLHGEIELVGSFVGFDGP